jgi:hypothetical protein
VAARAVPGSARTGGTADGSTLPTALSDQVLGDQVEA